jgi:hypothetical protein
LSRWFRFYNSVVHDPKVQRLQGDAFKAWVNLLCIASDNEGVLPCVQDLAFTLRLSEQETSELLDQLFRLGLLDAIEMQDAPMAYTPHNWEGRQFKSDGTDPTAPDRMKRYREKQRNDRNATVTVTDTRAEADQIRTDQKATGARAPDDDWPSDFREQFWRDFPNKVGKGAAIRKLETVRKRGVSWKVLTDGLARYKRTKPVDRPWCNPLTWLNEGRWDDAPDEPASASSERMSLEEAVRQFARTGNWSKHAPCGAPGLSDCVVPPELFAQYGLLPDGRKSEAA